MAPPKKDRCPNGHLYTPENSYHHPTKGGRVCKECHRAQSRESMRKLRRLRKEPVTVGACDEEGRWEPARTMASSAV